MNINAIQILFQIVNFFILLFLMKKYLYGPIMKILEMRSKKIEAGLEAAEKSIEEQDKIEKKRKRIIVEAEKNATQILEGARVRAKKVEKELQQKAELEIEKKRKKAEEHVVNQVSQMKLELQKNFSNSVVTTTEALLKESLSPKLQQEIIKKQTTQLKEMKFS